MARNLFDEFGINPETYEPVAAERNLFDEFGIDPASVLANEDTPVGASGLGAVIGRPVPGNAEVVPSQARALEQARKSFVPMEGDKPFTQASIESKKLQAQKENQALRNLTSAKEAKGNAVVGALVDTGANIGKMIFDAPEVVGRVTNGMVEPILSSADAWGRAMGLPEWMTKRQYKSPGDALAALSDVSTGVLADYIDRGVNSLAKDRDSAIGRDITSFRAQGQAADDALKQAIDKSDFTQLKGVLSDPMAWASFTAAAAPYMALMALAGGTMGSAMMVEGLAGAEDALDYERKNGRISDNKLAQATMISSLAGVLEKYGFDSLMKAKGTAGKIAAPFREGLTEIGQEGVANVGAMTYDKDRTFTQGMLQAGMGGAGMGAGVSGYQAMTTTPMTTQDRFASEMFQQIDGAQFPNDANQRAANILDPRNAQRTMATPATQKPTIANVLDENATVDESIAAAQEIVSAPVEMTGDTRNMVERALANIKQLTQDDVVTDDAGMEYTYVPGVAGQMPGLLDMDGMRLPDELAAPLLASEEMMQRVLERRQSTQPTEVADGGTDQGGQVPALAAEGYQGAGLNVPGSGGAPQTGLLGGLAGGSGSTAVPGATDGSLVPAGDAGVQGVTTPATPLLEAGATQSVTQAVPASLPLESAVPTLTTGEPVAPQPTQPITQEGQTQSPQVASEGVAKEPWQMTRDEYVHGDGFDLSPHAKLTGLKESPWQADGVSRATMTHKFQHILPAIEAGKTIPPEVLAEYPDLQEKAKTRTHTVTPAQQKVLDAVNASLVAEQAKLGDKAPPLQQLTVATPEQMTPAVRDELPLVLDVLRTMGYKGDVVVAASGNNTPMDFDGVVSTNGTGIVIAADSVRPVAFVLGHEFPHEIEKEAPAIYKTLADVILANSSEAKVVEHLQKRGYLDAKATAKDVTMPMRAEFVNDTFADMINNPKQGPLILLETAKNMDAVESGSGKDFLTRLNEFIKRVIKGMVGKGYGTEAAINKSELGAIRKAIAKALTDYNLQAKKAEKAAKAADAAEAEVRAAEAKKAALAAEVERAAKPAKKEKTVGTVSADRARGIANISAPFGAQVTSRTLEKQKMNIIKLLQEEGLSLADAKAIVADTGVRGPTPGPMQFISMERLADAVRRNGNIKEEEAPVEVAPPTDTKTDEVSDADEAKTDAAPAEYRYAMFNRPAGLGTIPKEGFIRSEPRPEKGEAHYDYARNGIAVFNRKLTDAETKNFEMAPMLEQADLDELAAAVVGKMQKYADGYREMATEEPEQFARTVSDKVNDVAGGYRPSIADMDAFVAQVKAGIAGESTEATPATDTQTTDMVDVIENSEGFDQEVADLLARFNAGNFKMPGTEAALSKTAKAKMAKENARIYAAAAKQFLEGDMTAPRPIKRGDALLDVGAVKGATPKTVQRSIKRAKSLDDTIKTLHSIAADGDVRYYLNGVHVEGSSLVASDGHRAVVVADVDVNGLPEKTEKERGLTILNRYFGKKKGSSGAEPTVRWIDGKFPDWQRIMPKEHETVRYFNSTDVSGYARGVAETAKYTSAGPVSQGYSGLTVTIAGESRSFNARYVADAMDVFRAFGYDTIEVSIQERGAPDGVLYLTSKDGKVRQVVMSMRGDIDTFAPVVATEKGTTGGGPKRSLRNTITQDTRDALIKGWTQIGGADTAFTYPRSESKSLGEIMLKVAPRLEVVSMDGDVDLEKAWIVYAKDTDGNVDRAHPGYVMQYKDGKIELNVAQWGEGNDGAALYAAVGNYAYNNDLVFAGDRMGISDTGRARRLENMISLALKYKTTRHIEPHVDMLVDFSWEEGNDNYNLGEMLAASYRLTAEVAPEIEDIVYDPDTKEFAWLPAADRRTGRPAGDGQDAAAGYDADTDTRGVPGAAPDFAAIIKRARDRGGRLGRKTLVRAILSNTFARRAQTNEGVGERAGDVVVPRDVTAKVLYSKRSGDDQQTEAGEANTGAQDQEGTTGARGNEPAARDRQDSYLQVYAEDEELARKLSHALAGYEQRLQPAIEQMLNQANDDWNALKGYVIPHKDSEAAGEAIARTTGIGIEQITEMLKTGSVDVNGEARHPVEILAAAMATVRINMAQLVDAENADDMAQRLTDVMNLMLAIRTDLSETGRALGYAGYAQMKNGAMGLGIAAQAEGKPEVKAADKVAEDADKEAVKAEKDAVDAIEDLTKKDGGAFKATMEAEQAENSAEDKDAEATDVEKAATDKKQEAQKKREVAKMSKDKAKTATGKAKIDAEAEAAISEQEASEAELKALAFETHAKNLRREAGKMRSAAKAARKRAEAALVKGRLLKQDAEAWAADAKRKMDRAKKLRAEAIAQKKEAMRVRAQAQRLIAKSHSAIVNAKMQADKANRAIKKMRYSLTKERILEAMGGEAEMQKIFDELKRQGHDVDLHGVTMLFQGMAGHQLLAMKKEEKGLAGPWSNRLGQANRIGGMAAELFKAYILSRFSTHALNVMSTWLHRALEMRVTKAIAEMMPGGVGVKKHMQVVRALTGVHASGWTAAMFAISAESRSNQMIKLLKMNAKDQKMVIDLTNNKWMDNQDRYLPGQFGKVVRNVGFTPLGAEDAYLKALPYLYSLALQEAAGRPIDYQEAVEYAETIAFQSHLSGFGQWINTIIKKVPVLGTHIPFITTLENLIVSSLKYTPGVGLVFAGVNQMALEQAIASGDGMKIRRAIDMRNMALARSIVGGVFGLLTILAYSGDDDDELMGLRPVDMNEFAIWRQENGALALRLWGYNVSFEKFDPIASSVGLTVSMVNAVNALTDDNEDTAALGALGQGVHQMLISKHFMEQFVTMLGSLGKKDGGEKAVTNYYANLLSAMTIPGAIAQFAEVPDEFSRETKADRNSDTPFLDAYLNKTAAKMPGMRDDLDAALDVWGQPADNPGYVNPAPVRPVKARIDPLNDWLLKMGKTVQARPLSLDGMPVEVKQELLRKRHDMLTTLMNNTNGLTRGEKKDKISNTIGKWTRKYVTPARARLSLEKMEDPNDAIVD